MRQRMEAIVKERKPEEGMNMADTHQEWLDQLEAESRAKQESFINGIASKLGRARVTEKPLSLTEGHLISGKHSSGL